MKHRRKLPRHEVQIYFIPEAWRARNRVASIYFSSRRLAEDLIELLARSPSVNDASLYTDGVFQGMRDGAS